jgi:hypothetical protein
MIQCFVVVVSLLHIVSVDHQSRLDNDDKEPLSISNLLPSKQELTLSLANHYREVTKASLSEFNYKERGKFLQYLPNIGYNFVTHSPHITYQTSLLFGALNASNVKKARIVSIKRQVEITFQDDLEKLYNHLSNLEAAIELYNYRIGYYRLHEDLFNILSEKYKNLEITPFDYIQGKIKLKGEEISLRKEYNQLITKRNLILDIAKAHPKEKLFSHAESNNLPNRRPG